MACSPSSCKTWKNCFKVPRCFFFSKELMETKGWVPRTRVEAQSCSALPAAKLEGSAHPSCAGAAPFQPRRFWSHGDFGEQAVGQPPFQLAQLQPKKREFWGQWNPVIGWKAHPADGTWQPGNNLIDIFMFCFVAVKGWVSLFDVRSTFLQKQKKSGGRTVSTWQGIDRGEDNWCSRLTCSYFGERDASGACVALGINIELIPVPHQEYLFAHKQPFCSFFLGCVFQVNSQQISISAFPTSHLPSGRIQLEKK